MSEKFCVKWGDFQNSVISTFGNLRKSCEFADVTLVCEDGQQVEAHKVILTASSPFFQKLLHRNSHPHPLVYMRGVNAKELAGIVDFLYYGEANVHQDSLDAFLKLADELQLKGLTDVSETHAKSRNGDRNIALAKQDIKSEEKQPNVDEEVISTSHKPGLLTQNNFVHLEELNTVIKVMMQKSEKLILAGKRWKSEKKKYARAFICKVCGKEGLDQNIRSHIERYHIEGLSLPCHSCEKKFNSRILLSDHKKRDHQRFDIKC